MKKLITNKYEFFKKLSEGPINVMDCGLKLSRSIDIKNAHEFGFIRYEKINGETYLVRNI